MLRCTVCYIRFRRLTVNQSCQILGLAINANEKDVKNAYLSKVKIYHPDNQETGDEGKFRNLKKAKTVLEDYIKNPNVEHENPKINHDQNARMHARRHAATMKLVKERREESKQKALAFIVAILGVSGFMLYMWHLQTTTMRKITKIEFINMSKKYKVPVWLIFEEYRNFYASRLRRAAFEPKFMAFEDIQYLDQHFRDLHPVIARKMLFSQRPEDLKLKY